MQNGEYSGANHADRLGLVAECAREGGRALVSLFDAERGCTPDRRAMSITSSATAKVRALLDDGGDQDTPRGARLTTPDGGNEQEA
jgi:hypothetical protein